MSTFEQLFFLGLTLASVLVWAMELFMPQKGWNWLQRHASWLEHCIHIAAIWAPAALVGLVIPVLLGL
jgi:hypothetical protein